MAAPIRTLCALSILIAIASVQFAASTSGAAQRAGTIATVIKPKAESPQDLQALIKRLEELERRVKELEDGDIEELASEEEEEAKAKRLEERLASLEKARSSDPARETAPPASSASGPSPSTIRAPLIVQDASGNVLLSVGTAAANGEPELVLGSAAGARVALRVTRRGGASLAMYDSANVPRVALVGNPDQSLFRLGGRGAAVDMSANPTTSRVDVVNAAGHAGVTLEIRGEHGRFTLGDAAGQTTVEAGTVVGQGVGVVRAGPDLGGATGAMSGGLVIPRAILGRKK
jgi:hypothetical protein